MPLSEEDENLLENTLNSVSLTNSTGYSQVDQIIQGVIGIFERIFSDRIRSYYLLGSYANGTAISTNDYDQRAVYSLNGAQYPKGTKDLYRAMIL